MGILDCLSPRALVTSLLLLSTVTEDVFARPTVEPKLPWAYKGPSRKKMSNHIRRAMGKKANNETCAKTLAKDITAPKANIWGALSDVETAGVVEWLFAQPELNLTTSDDAGEWDNVIQLVEAMWPNKTDALAYVDGTAAPPTKYAHVLLNNRATETPYYADILVGPLPIDNKTASWEPLTYPYNKNTGDGKVRNLVADSESFYTEWVYKLGAEIADITLDLWNATVMGLENDTLVVWGIDPVWQEDNSIIRWDAFWASSTDLFDSGTLLPLGLYFMTDMTAGRDPSTWKFEGWLYNNIFYETTEAFRAAYWSESAPFEKNLPAIDGEWAWTDQAGEPLPLDEYHPPEQVAPAGARFGIDHKENYVEWQDYSFYISFNRDTGVNLYDIRYKGERILYELGLQEALAHYAGIDPMQSGTAYLDTFYGFGPYAFELVQGYDCPAYATYVNTSFYIAETTHTHINSICLFEATADYPIQRHSTDTFVSITKNNYFVLRSVSTVGNYDYTFTYSFFVDGSISVEVRASGYIQSAYWANNGDYGFHIHDALSGSMHDHVLNFKADFDILGTNNSVELMSMVPATVTYPWSKGKARNTMKLERTFIENETESRFNWGENGATQVLIVNEDEKNKYGEYRGYRVLPYTGTSHLTVKNSSNLLNAAHWAEYDLQFTKQKDTEPRVAHAYNNMDTVDPPVDFAKFFDGECLRKEDLVLWVNLGMHHVPHTGDLPNTVMTTAHSGIQFMPSNYFLSDVSRRTVHQIRIDYEDGVTSHVEEFNKFTSADNITTCKLDYTPVKTNHWNYTGDIVVRKFPFDPNNPFFDTQGIE
ncbi:copper amine oxidase [Rhypophila decipiens]|uniref:Amine oxidase n=1 Tax=Rhypophila decipiens TaxID=261697 RepID=A0AAN6XX12_9PEZI|nr:copper amine oxidase [Rhypophila decipiens]